MCYKALQVLYMFIVFVVVLFFRNEKMIKAQWRAGLKGQNCVLEKKNL